ncbi:hypothetical protein NM688_g8601 [Phlebia brevispora]|uniref:Uncharacterized protein n=1 Tax=Phlebia brevispora TaxID=194682 RepID=A0ACC1RTB8_9APHY|nr:hypothetical protein NM688_g8601 [Phlebia brevispora]
MSSPPYEEPASPISEDSSDTPPDEYFMQGQGYPSSALAALTGGFFWRELFRERREAKAATERLVWVWRSAANTTQWQSSEISGAVRTQKADDLLDHQQVETIRKEWGDPFDDSPLKKIS